KESGSDQESADRLRESRLALIVLGFSKTDIRNAGPEFHSDYFESRLPESVPQPPTLEATPITIPGLDLEVEGPSITLQKAQALTDTILKAKTVLSSSEGVDLERQQKAGALYSEVREAADNALDLAGR